jgi:dTDP-4-amino-4,6-dideoxygalactose transaminase
VTELSQRYLSAGVPSAWRIRRRQNVARLLARLGKSKHLLTLFDKWPLDAAPLGAVFAAPSQEQRDDLRRQLEECRVYCPVLWPPAKDCDPAARRLAERLLTIPTDQRYGGRDMEKVAAIVNRLRLGVGSESRELNCGHARI